MQAMDSAKAVPFAAGSTAAPGTVPVSEQFESGNSSKMASKDAEKLGRPEAKDKNFTNITKTAIAGVGQFGNSIMSLQRESKSAQQAPSAEIVKSAKVGHETISDKEDLAPQNQSNASSILNSKNSSPK